MHTFYIESQVISTNSYPCLLYLHYVNTSCSFFFVTWIFQMPEIKRMQNFTTEMSNRRLKQNQSHFLSAIFAYKTNRVAHAINLYLPARKFRTMWHNAKVWRRLLSKKSNSLLDCNENLKKLISKLHTIQTEQLDENEDYCLIFLKRVCLLKWRLSVQLNEYLSCSLKSSLSLFNIK